MQLQKYIDNFDIITIYPNIMENNTGYEQRKYDENDIKNIKKTLAKFNANEKHSTYTESFYRNLIVMNTDGNITRLKKNNKYDIINNHLLLLTKIEYLETEQIPSINPDFTRTITSISFSFNNINISIDKENNVYTIGISLLKGYSEEILNEIILLF
ncbi:hypothetical protein BMW23_0684 [Bodo saltans virus]|jgi:hypothetical protein|uniref:Uncharacterized protein n=1 Tax=Bodo saltans virus TaxID=2024608 RepID=A0A2H4UUY1_9VIRU|nr:hypothetical protein QJ851_gp0667 [Bodo saltans virus]ATZ80730.1 hypothetical protein BMW23_0684 [Bodo saltans virus]